VHFSLPLANHAPYGAASVSLWALLDLALLLLVSLAVSPLASTRDGGVGLLGIAHGKRE